MSEPWAQASPDPRWGSEDRDRKAAAIWMTLLHYAAPEIAKGRWLDIGCGSGGIAEHIAPKIGEMMGIDQEPALILPASVDVVICNQVYEHVPDPVALIAFIHRVLKPGGYCYFAGPNLLFPIELHVFWPFVHWLPRARSTRLMHTLGSRKADELGAYSTHYWQLKAWLTPLFTVSNAVPFVIREVVPTQHSGLFWQVFFYLPKQLLDAFTPISPCFVFVLKKDV